MVITIALAIGAAATILAAINLPSIQKRQYTVVKPRLTPADRLLYKNRVNTTLSKTYK
ncbi:MAG: hypothetical protein ABSF80_05480 [Chitinispirillaceae bacterium]|jgi:hypothetical protein